MTTEQVNENVREMFKVIRSAEIKNDKTGKYDDKAMVNRIRNYILEIAKKEVEQEEQNEV